MPIPITRLLYPSNRSSKNQSFLFCARTCSSLGHKLITTPCKPWFINGIDASKFNRIACFWAVISYNLVKICSAARNRWATSNVICVSSTILAPAAAEAIQSQTKAFYGPSSELYEETFDYKYLSQFSKLPESAELLELRAIFRQKQLTEQLLNCPTLGFHQLRERFPSSIPAGTALICLELRHANALIRAV